MHILSGSIPKDFIGGVLYIIQENYPLYLEGVKYTLLISIVGTIFGLFVALFITIFRNDFARTSPVWMSRNSLATTF